MKMLARAKKKYENTKEAYELDRTTIKATIKKEETPVGE